MVYGAWLANNGENLTFFSRIRQILQEYEPLHSRQEKHVHSYGLAFGGWGEGGGVSLTLRKFASNWLATALASRVFPVPGGPYSRQPCNISNNNFIQCFFHVTHMMWM
jgi:hypothetical protein